MQSRAGGSYVHRGVYVGVKETREMLFFRGRDSRGGTLGVSRMLRRAEP